MSKPKTLYPSNHHEIMRKQLHINTLTLILLFLLTVGFFIFAFLCKGASYGAL